MIWCTVYKASHVSLYEEGQVSDFTGGETPQGRKPRLLEQVHGAVRRLHYSRRTEEAYVHWIKRFIYWSGRRHPATLGEAEVTAFLSHLASERNVAASTQKDRKSELQSPCNLVCRLLLETNSQRPTTPWRLRGGRSSCCAACCPHCS